MTVISDYVLTSSFCVRHHSRQFQERLERTFRLSAHVTLPIDSRFICGRCSFVFRFIMKRQRTLSSFFTPKRMPVEPEKHEDGLDKDGGEAGEVSLMMSVDVQSFNIIV